MSPTGAARLAGVAGWPVSQSLSPALHGHWLAEHGIDGAYVPLPVRPDEFAADIQALARMGFRGVNVTVPHKEAAFALADRLDAAARTVGAVNLLVFDNGFQGCNTDVSGLRAALVEELGRDCVQGRVAAVWGAGGTARAAVVALSQMGASEIRIFNRTPARAEQLAKALEGVPTPLSAAGYGAWTARRDGVALIVHATSAGMNGKASIALPLDGLASDAALCDVVYNPLKTDLLERAAAAGLRTVDGLGMLMHQAVPSFAAFYGITPRVTPALRAVLEKALRV
ncbi:MAG: shikimate dehydrogenase [Alphaproteobacteria bacterium]|nr:shikimate dehydrogenase [Alphaproteobacteria bacterium]